MKKKLKFGVNSSVVIIFAIVIVILLNIAASLFEEKFPALRIDVTEGGLTKISKTTKDVLKALDESETDIEIVYLKGTGSEDNDALDLIKRYDAASENITTSVKDYVKDPTLLGKYNITAAGNIDGAVVVCANNQKNPLLITQADMWRQTQTGVTFLLENRITNAIGSLMSARTMNACISQGHSEAEPAYLIDALTQENVNVTVLDLSTGDIPDDVDIFFVLSPTVDFTQSEIDALDDFLAKGKSVILAFGFNISLPRLEAFAESWGLVVNNDIVLEQNPAYSVQQTGMYFYPILMESAVSSGVDGRMIASFARSIKAVASGDISQTPILVTSSGGCSVPVVNGELDSESMTEGSFPIAYLLEKPLNGSFEETAKLFVASTPTIFGAVNSVTTEFDYLMLLSLSEPSYGNGKFVTNCVFYAADYEGVSVAVKTRETNYLNISTMQSLIFIAVFCVILPLLVIVAGIIMWLKRRHM